MESFSHKEVFKDIGYKEQILGLLAGGFVDQNDLAFPQNCGCQSKELPFTTAEFARFKNYPKRELRVLEMTQADLLQSLRQVLVRVFAVRVQVFPHRPEC